MPIPAAITAAIIGASASAASSGIQQGVSAGRTKKARRWQEGQYNKQRLHFLEDRDYNTPENQMSRYKDAGLNPNLIYGNGSSSAGNANPSGASTPTPATVNAGTKYKIDPYGEIGKYLATKIAGANSRKAEADAKVAEDTVIDRVNQQYYQVSKLMLETEDLMKTVDAKKRKGMYDVYQSLKQEQLRLAEYQRSLREQGASEKDPFYIRRMIAKYSGDTKALSRVLNAAAIADGIGNVIPKNLLFGAGFLRKSKPSLKTNINAPKGQRVIKY